MLNWMQYQLQRRHLLRALRTAYKRDKRAMAKAKASGATKDQIDELQLEQAQENWLIEDELQQLETRDLCLQAHRYKVPIPSHDDKDLWEQSHNIGGWQLTAKGFATLRADVRREQNERWQWWELRTKVVIAVATAFTGLIGAMIGWVALVRH